MTKASAPTGARCDPHDATGGRAVLLPTRPPTERFVPGRPAGSDNRMGSGCSGLDIVWPRFSPTRLELDQARNCLPMFILSCHIGPTLTPTLWTSAGAIDSGTLTIRGLVINNMAQRPTQDENILTRFPPLGHRAASGSASPVQRTRGGRRCCARSFCFSHAVAVVRAFVAIEVPKQRRSAVARLMRMASYASLHWLALGFNTHTHTHKPGPNLGPNWAGIRPNLGRMQAIVDNNWPRFAPAWRNVDQCWPKSTKLWQCWPELG